MTVYLDVIWALNLLFDSLLLYLTAIFLKRRIQIWRLLAGGFIGSIIILLWFTPVSTYSNHPLSKLFCSVLMVLAAFGYKRFSFFIKGLMTLYVATFLIGGALIGTHYFIQYDSNMTLEFLKSLSNGFGDPITWLFVLIGFPIAWHFSKKNVENFEIAKIQFDQIVKVQVTIGDVTFFCKGLVDSGNQLYDPLSKNPVMIVSIRNLMEELPEPIIKIASDHEDLLMGNIELPLEWQNRLRVVPCRVVGQENQLVITVKPDSINIHQNGDQYLCEKGLISFTIQQLSADDAFDSIVHPKMLTGRKQQNESVKVS